MKIQQFFPNIKVIASCAAILMIPIGKTHGTEENVNSQLEASAQLAAEIMKRGSEEENLGLLKKLRIEAAYSGDKAEREKIITELRDKNPVRQADAIEMARSIGGADMVYALAELLSDTNGYRMVEVLGMPQGSTPQGDIVFGPPSEQAAIALSHLIENPPVPPIGKGKKFYTEEDVFEWRKWWQANKAKFDASR